MSKESKKNIKRVKHEKQLLRKSVNRWAGVGIVALIVLAVGAFYLSRPKAALPLDEARLAANPSIGSDSATVVITEYADFGCTACRAWHAAGIMERIFVLYSEDVQFIWKDFPVITPQSPKAAEAGQCAFDQGKFWEYHNMVYDNYPSLDVNSLKEFAARVGLDTNEFDQCLDSGKNRAKVEQSLNEALRQYNFPGTPSFLINGKKLVGPPSFETLKVMIDEILADG
jgi:protein-disulfide isomerase